MLISLWLIKGSKEVRRLQLLPSETPSNPYSCVCCPPSSFQERGPPRQGISLPRKKADPQLCEGRGQSLKRKIGPPLLPAILQPPHERTGGGNHNRGSEKVTWLHPARGSQPHVWEQFPCLTEQPVHRLLSSSFTWEKGFRTKIKFPLCPLVTLGKLLGLSEPLVSYLYSAAKNA